MRHPLHWRHALKGIGRLTDAVLGCVSSACPLCMARAQGGGLCQLCRDDLQRGRSMSGLPALAGVEQVIHAFAYEAPGDVLVWQYKNGLRLRHARLLASLMADAAREECWQAQGGSVLVPIPSSRASLMRRGFNPARELSRHLSRQLGVAERPDWLLRSETASKQAGLGKRQRAANMTGVFRCPHSVEGVSVVLIDDVVTTGNTVIAAAQALHAAGAWRVDVLAVARVPPPGGTNRMAGI